MVGGLWAPFLVIPDSATGAVTAFQDYSLAPLEHGGDHEHCGPALCSEASAMVVLSLEGLKPCV